MIHGRATVWLWRQQRTVMVKVLCLYVDGWRWWYLLVAARPLTETMKLMMGIMDIHSDGGEDWRRQLVVAADIVGGSDWLWRILMVTAIDGGGVWRQQEGIYSAVGVDDGLVAIESCVVVSGNPIQIPWRLQRLSCSVISWKTYPSVITWPWWKSLVAHIDNRKDWW